MRCPPLNLSMAEADWIAWALENYADVLETSFWDTTSYTDDDLRDINRKVRRCRELSERHRDAAARAREAFYEKRIQARHQEDNA